MRPPPSRRLRGLCRILSAALFLVLCGLASYAAGTRARAAVPALGWAAGAPAALCPPR